MTAPRVDCERQHAGLAVTDVAGWPAWDPHEKAARLEGPFAPGTAGWSSATAML